MADFRLSPSRVARFYFHECERHLRYSATPSRRAKAEGIPVVPLDQSIVTKAVLDTGYAWEEKVIDLLGSAAAVPRIEAGQVRHEARHSVEETARLLQRAPAGTWIYQATLRAPRGFYDAYGLDADVVEFVDCHPDLIVVDEVDGLRRLRVVDAKASDEMKLSHRIQAALYTLILRHVLADLHVSGEVTDQAGIWLANAAHPEWFDLDLVVPPLETFLERELEPILRAPLDDVFWHLYFRCEWCDYYSHCRKEAEDTDDVSLVPYLSTFAKRHLARRAGISTTSELGAALAKPDAEEILAGCASLEGRGPRLRKSVEALHSGTAVPTDAASVAMPIGENCRVVMTLQTEPVTGALYGYAINRVGGKEIFGTGSATVCRVAQAGEPASLRTLRDLLVEDLLGILGPVHDYNAGKSEWSDQRTLQVFVFDVYEREILVDSLLRSVVDGADPAAAMILLFHFQHPDLAVADDHPAKEVFYPAIALTEVLRGVMALPIPVVYRFAEVVQTIRPSQYAFDYTHDEFHGFELSNRMKSTAILMAWNQGRTDLVRSIETELKRRVWAANSVVNGLREQLADGGTLFSWPPKFFLSPSLSFRDPLLSRLAFLANYEMVVAMQEARAARTAPDAERLGRGETLRLAYVDGQTFRVTGEFELEESTFLSWILTEDSVEGRRARVAFDDFGFRNRHWPPKKLPLALAAPAKVNTDGTVELALSPSGAFAALRKGAGYFLDARETDWNTGRVLTELSAIDGSTDPWFTRVLVDPAGTRQRISVDDAVRAVTLDLASKHGMTPSQLAALEGLVDHDLQLVWGPPGTGKTHFLALMTLCLLEAHRRAGKPLRVLFTAFTHTAIDNCLRKIRTLQEDIGVVGGAFGLAKIAKDGTAPVETVDYRSAADWIGSRDLCVAGSTVWQAWRIDPGDLSYDMVVVDEGSQLKVWESAIAARRLKSGGRLVVAGDDRQLPPVIRGTYPAVDGEPLLHRSLLECLRERPGAEACVTTLLENFRMAEPLCAYPRASIYPDGYRPATDEIAGRRLVLGPPSGAIADDGVRALLDAVLDPDAPLVVCVLEDVQATRENPVEAALVAEIGCELRRRVASPEDQDFWRDDLFVVSPHHAQIRLTRREFAARRKWASPSFIDTVDKMQGQECDTVIVSYGVADVEYALSEREFIYSLNRLNVAITRARAKCIVFLSRALLEPPIQALDVESAAEGIALMQGLVRWCAGGSEPIEQTLLGVRITTYLR